MRILASSVEHGPRDRSRKAVRAIRRLSPSIVSKRIYLAVDLTVSSAYADDNSRNFSCLEVPKTIEWESPL